MGQPRRLGRRGLPITGSAVHDPHGLIVDAATGKLYWTNSSANTIASANLDGSDPTILPINSSDLDFPLDLAIDSASGRIYWANCDGNSIGYANLDGSGAGTLATAPVTPNCPNGVAVDPAAGKLYWSNDASPGTISYANLDGSGGGDVVSSPAPSPERMALIEAPIAAGAPSISGGSTAGSILTCSTGSWAPDLLESHLYQVPESFAYTWTLDGTPLAGATTSSISASSGGQYACQVTGTNPAGAAAQASAAYAVQAAPLSPSSPPAPSTPTPSEPTNSVSPQITGAAEAGHALTCSPGGWSGSPSAYTFAWSEDGTPIQGATESTYRVQTADEGLGLTCTVAAANSAGAGRAATSHAVQVTVPKVAGCPAATGSIGGNHLGQIRLGMTRRQVRQASRHDSVRGRGNTDLVCLTPTGVRIGYVSPQMIKTLSKRLRAAVAGRVIWTVTSNRHYAVDGIRPGATVSAASQALRLGQAFRADGELWYVVSQHDSTVLLSVRGGIVEVIGIADGRLTHSRSTQLSLLHSI